MALDNLKPFDVIDSPAGKLILLNSLDIPKGYWTKQRTAAWTWPAGRLPEDEETIYYQGSTTKNTLKGTCLIMLHVYESLTDVGSHPEWGEYGP